MTLGVQCYRCWDWRVFRYKQVLMRTTNVFLPALQWAQSWQKHLLLFPIFHPRVILYPARVPNNLGLGIPDSKSNFLQKQTENNGALHSRFYHTSAIYRRSGNFRRYNISSVKFSSGLIFVVEGDRRKFVHDKNFPIYGILLQ